MTTDVTASKEELIAALDPLRNYGPRTYEEVVAQVRAGEIEIRVGKRVPVLLSAKTHMHVHGSGIALDQGSRVLSAASREYIRTRFNEDVEAWYEALYIAGVKNMDVKAMKLAFEFGAERPVEGKDQGGAASVMMRMLEMMEKGEGKTQRVVDAETVERG